MSAELVEAFARGLMQAIVQSNGPPTKKPAEPRPKVVKTDDVKEAVAAYLRPLLEETEPAPTASQLDFTFAQEPEESAEANALRENLARMQRGNSGFYDPNTGADEGGSTPWTGPSVAE